MPKGGSKARITKRLSDALDHILDGRAKDVKNAAEMVGLSPSALYKALKKPNVANEIKTRIQKRRGAFGVARAWAVLEGLLSSDSDAIRLQAAEKLLQYGGIRPPADPQQPQGGGVNIHAPGYVFIGGGDAQQLTSNQPAQANAATISVAYESVPTDGESDRGGGPSS